MLWSTAVRWASGVIVVSVAIRSVTETVPSRVDPPAPYVTDTNDGRRRSSSRRAVHSWGSASGVLGGKNSKDQVGREEASSSRTVGVTTGQKGTCARAGLRGTARRKGPAHLHPATGTGAKRGTTAATTPPRSRHSWRTDGRHRGNSPRTGIAPHSVGRYWFGDRRGAAARVRPPPLAGGGGARPPPRRRDGDAERVPRPAARHPRRHGPDPRPRRRRGVRPRLGREAAPAG